MHTHTLKKGNKWEEQPWTTGLHLSCLHARQWCVSGWTMPKECLIPPHACLQRRFLVAEDSTQNTHSLETRPTRYTQEYKFSHVRSLAHTRTHTQREGANYERPYPPKQCLLAGHRQHHAAKTCGLASLPQEARLEPPSTHLSCDALCSSFLTVHGKSTISDSCALYRTRTRTTCTHTNSPLC